MEILSENKKFGIRYGIDDDGLLFFGDGKTPETKITFHDSEEQRNLCKQDFERRPSWVVSDLEKRYLTMRLLALENVYSGFLYRKDYSIEDLRTAYKNLSEFLEDNLLRKQAMEKAIQLYEVHERQKGFYNLLNKGVFDLSGLNKLRIRFNSCIDLAKCTKEIRHKVYISEEALDNVIHNTLFHEKLAKDREEQSEGVYMEEIFAEMDRITGKFYNEIDQLTEKLQPKQRPYIRKIVSEITNASEDQKAYLENALATSEKYELEKQIAYYRRMIQRGVYTIDELKAKYVDYESHRIEWKERGSKNYRDFCRGQEALEFIIAEMNHQKGEPQ